MIGSTLDKYEVLQKLGEGGMATVYRGRHATLDRDVAIKVLHPHLSSSTRNRKRFEREARAIEHLRHPNILEIFDYSGVQSGDCYIVTEFVEGETLSELLARCRRTPSEVAAMLGIALADALAYAHHRGVLHRDVKPDNIMVRRDGTVKLMDFGIARFLDESQVTLTGALVGSPAFMSPEQAREDDLDHRSDLFSLGTVLFLLVTGHLPFQGSNPSLILKHIIEGERPQVLDLVPGANPAVADVIEQLLAPRPEERFQDADAVGAALEAALQEVGMDPTERRWSVARYLQDPDAYETDLEGELEGTLLTKARALLDAGEPLRGLRLVNRLLSIDEDHTEALALLQAFHGVDSGPPSGRRWRAWVAAAVMLLVFGGMAVRWVFDPASPGEDPTEATPRDEVPSTATAEARPTPTEAAPVVVDPPEREPAAEANDDDGTAEVEAETPTAPGSPTRVADPLRDAVRDAAPAATVRAPTKRNPPEPTAPPEPEAGTAEAVEPACVALRSREPAAMYLDGVRLRGVRDPGCTELAPGTYTFELRGDMVRTREITVELAAGQVEDKLMVDLERLPARVRFGRQHADDCVVLVDGMTRGTVARLDRSVELEHPETPHTVELDCGGKRTARTYRRIDYPEVLFDGRETP